MTPEKLKQLREQIDHCVARGTLARKPAPADLDALFAQAAACEVWKREAMAARPFICTEQMTRWGDDDPCQYRTEYKAARRAAGVEGEKK